MPFRLAAVLGVIIFTVSSAGCAAEELRPDGAPDEPEIVGTTAAPVVGTWRWSASGHRIGDIDLGEEHFVFRENGTYAVVSKAGDGWSECYEGTFTWSPADEPGHGKILFKGSHVRSAEGFERDVFLDGNDTLDFGEGGTYRRTTLDMRCP